MPLKDTLARVDADLAAGRIPAARQRLRGLVSSFPSDLTLRRRLAEVYRLYDEPAEAGRWMYLEEDRDPAETAAFETRYGTTSGRMRALGWKGSESRAPDAWPWRSRSGDLGERPPRPLRVSRMVDRSNFPAQHGSRHDEPRAPAHAPP
ncbi:DUF6584 family protein [Streptomyces sp. CAS3]